VPTVHRLAKHANPFVPKSEHPRKHAFGGTDCPPFQWAEAWARAPRKAIEEHLEGTPSNGVSPAFRLHSVPWVPLRLLRRPARAFSSSSSTNLAARVWPVVSTPREWQ